MAYSTLRTILPLPVTPPIPDANNNKKLDYKDLLSQLAIEDKRPGPHGLRAANVIGFIKFIDVMEELGATIRTEKQCSDTALNKANQSIAANFKNALSLYDQIKVTPDRRELLTQRIKEHGKAEGLSNEAIAALVIGNMAFIDFGETFASTFSQGIDLQSTDLPELLQRIDTVKNKSATTFESCGRPSSAR